MDECYAECDSCDDTYDPHEHGAECECGGYIELFECLDGCDYCE